MHAGRLNNKLLRYFTERNPRLFYKSRSRQQKSTPFHIARRLFGKHA
ncbi:hypothetical protein PO124_03620 [Bacillus licheniformis]|nr:hypothetical protein [Bacillus licheniformis]